MERKPHSTGSIVGAVVLLVVVPLGLYVGGYFVLGRNGPKINGVVIREYAYDWQASVYRPMVRLEGAVTDKEVYSRGPTVIYRSDGVVRHKIGRKWVRD